MYTSIIGYLQTVDFLHLDELYSHPPTCLIVFRELPELAKHLVIRLLFIEQPIPKPIIVGWVEKYSQDLLNDAFNALQRLRVWHSVDSNTARGSWKLNKKFQECMKTSLFGGGKPLLSDLGSTTCDKHSRDEEFLDAYSNERWDSILHFMVGSEQAEVGVVVKDVLLLSNLMKGAGTDTPVGITKAGFQFLLMNRSAQVLQFMLHYFDYLNEKSANLVEALQFVFQLSFLSPRKSYPVDPLTSNQQEFLQHMRELGLAYQRKRTAARFYITKLALGLAGDRTMAVPAGVGGQAVSSATIMQMLPSGVTATGTNSSDTLSSGAANADIGYIILETNFRLYAYTDSPLRTALLSLFSKIRCRFANFVVADVTRDSVREALIRGITANQIISFLTANAHPSVAQKTHILPPTIVDQLRLWELERDRFVFQEGCLYEQFTKNSDFEMVRDYAKSIDVLLWSNTERRLMVVSKNGHEDVRKFWKQKRPG